MTESNPLTVPHLVHTVRWSLCVLLAGFAGACDLGDESGSTDDGELQIAGGAITMSTGESVQLKLVPVNGQGQPVSDLYTITWMSANASVASITTAGLLAGVAAGSTTVTALATVVKSGVTASASVPVTVVAGVDSCGTGTCSTTETCTSCPADCGACPPPADLSGPQNADMGPHNPVDAGPQTAVTFTALSGDFPAPGRGVQHWGTTNWDDVYVPTVPAGNSTPMNYYTRFNWQDIESSTVQGAYSWTVFDNFAHSAMDQGAMFSFGVMAYCNGCGSFGEVPAYVQTLMAGEGKPGWSDGGFMVPNYQSTKWQARYTALLQAVADHITATSYKGKTYTSAFLGYDLRHYGNFGEGWGEGATPPAGAQVTDAYLISMTDAAIAIFPNVQLTIPMEYVAPNNDYNNADDNPGTQAAYHVLTASNSYGRIGWRRDNIGDDGYNAYFTGTTASYSGTALKPLIMNMWQLAPIGGEPAADLSGTSRCGSIQCDLHNEDTLFHMSYMGNGNFPVQSSSNPALVTAVRSASAEQGYRIALAGGAVTTTLKSGSIFNITLQWINSGLAPVYEKWDITFELRKSDGSVAWTGKSAFSLRLFLPQATATPASDDFTLPAAVAAGTYDLYLVIRDPAAYKKPLPLAITGRGTDGSYLVRSGIVVGS